MIVKAVKIEGRKSLKLFLEGACGTAFFYSINSVYETETHYIEFNTIPENGYYQAERLYSNFLNGAL